MRARRPVPIAGLVAGALIVAGFAGQSAPAQSSPPAELRLTWTPAGQRQAVPFDFANGVIFIRATVAGRPAWAIVDNRAERSLVDLGFARAAGLRIGPASGVIQTASGQAPLSVVADVPVAVPGQLSSIGSLAATDLSDISRAVGRPVALVIGADYFLRLAFTFHFSNRRLEVAPGGVVAPAGSRSATLVDGRPRVEAAADGQPLRLTLDLGYNGDLILGEAAWKRLGLDRAPQTLGHATHVQGDVFTARHAALASLAIGPFTAQRIDASLQPILPGDGDGLVGAGFLSRFDFTLDTGARRLWLLGPTGR